MQQEPPAMPKAVISTPHAPSAIGTYSQAVRCGDTIYVSGQIGLDPATMQLVEGIDAQVKRVFDNLKAVAAAAGGTLDDAAKLTIYLTDLAHFAKVNEVMAAYFNEPYPARAAIGVASLPRSALIEADAILVIQ
jgi:reactive intermediate/imine deaminase